MVNTCTRTRTGQVQLGFSEADYAVTEGDETMVTIIKNNPNVGTINLRIVPMTYDQFDASGQTLDPVIANIRDNVIPTGAQCEKPIRMIE